MMDLHTPPMAAMIMAIGLFFLLVFFLLFRNSKNNKDEKNDAGDKWRNLEKQSAEEKQGKQVRFGVQQTRLFNEEVVIDCEDQRVKSKDSSLDLKDPRYQIKLRT